MTSTVKPTKPKAYAGNEKKRVGKERRSEASAISKNEREK
jgi:hypothetical protein